MSLDNRLSQIKRNGLRWISREQKPRQQALAKVRISVTVWPSIRGPSRCDERLYFLGTEAQLFKHWP